jgi:hypothetical protein
MPRFHYRRKTENEIESIAAEVLNRHSSLLNGNILDIERLVEQYGITVLVRQRLKEPVAGYLAKDPQFIVMPEWAYNYRPNLRETLAEELSHILLEHSAYKLKALPVHAACHNLTPKQHFDIENNAHMLGSALLLPKPLFLSHWWAAKAKFADGNVSSDRLLHLCSNSVARDFQVLHRAVYKRAKDLKVISHPEFLSLTRVNHLLL